VARYFAPARTPPAAVKAWQAAQRESAADLKFKAAMAKINVTIDYLDGYALKARYDTWLSESLKRSNPALLLVPDQGCRLSCGTPRARGSLGG